MNQDAEKLRGLIAQNRIEGAFNLLLQLVHADQNIYTQVITLKAKFTDARRKENLGLLNSADISTLFVQVNYALLTLISEYEENIAVPLLLPSAYTRVFISYNHSDAEAAIKLKEKLSEQGIAVTIDNEHMQAGEDIKKFIDRCIQDSDVTVSIISKKSLLSAWVAMETVNTFYHEKTNKNKKFIACYVDNDFFDRKFTDHALHQIDMELKKIQTQIKKRLDKGYTTRDLNNEYTRLKELSNNIDEIIRRLRESLCIDIRQESLEKNLAKIIRSIQE